MNTGKHRNDEYLSVGNRSSFHAYLRQVSKSDLTFQVVSVLGSLRLLESGAVLPRQCVPSVLDNSRRITSFDLTASVLAFDTMRP